MNTLTRTMDPEIARLSYYLGTYRRHRERVSLPPDWSDDTSRLEAEIAGDH